MAEDNNQMREFAPLLIGAGLLASVFWFGKGERRLPSEFGSLSGSRLMTKAELYRAWKHHALPVVQDRYEQDGIPDKPARRESWNDYVDFSIRHKAIPLSAENWTHPKGLETTKS